MSGLVVILLIGTLLGSLGSSDVTFGAFVGAAIGWLLLRSRRLQQQINELQRSVEALKAAAATPPATYTAWSAPKAPVQPPPAAVLPPPEPSTQPITRPIALPEPPPVWHRTMPPFSDTSSRPPEPTHVLPAMLQHWLVGGNMIVKAGVAILFIGLAFLAKYASEHVQVPVELRLASIGCVALALLALGWKLRERRAGYAQVLQGGAVAVLYLTLFAASTFYGALTVGTAFALMVLVAALAAALAVLQHARPLAVIGALGGFATPLLLSTGSGNHIALFSYYLVLDLGIAAVAWHTTWRSLNLIGFLATFVIATAWGVLSYNPVHYASSQGFLLAYFVLFDAILLMPIRQPETIAGHDTGRWVNGSLLFGLPSITFVLQVGLVHQTTYGVALSCLALAGFYVLQAWRLRGKPQLTLLFEASLAIGTLFLTLVIPFALDASQTSGAWALEGAGLIWLGWRQARKEPRWFGYLLLLLSGLMLGGAHSQHDAPAQVLNGSMLNALLLAAGSLMAAYTVQRHRSDTDGSAPAEPLLIGWATLWLLIAAQWQIHQFVPATHALAAWLGVLSGLALLYLGLSRRLQWPHLATPLMAHAPALAIGVLCATTLANPAHHGGWWAWPLALCTHALVLRHAVPRWTDATAHAVHGLGALVLAGLSAVLGRALTADWGDTASAWPWLGWLAGPALLLFWLPRPASRQRWPVSALPSAYQASASAVLTAGALLWTLLANAVSDGAAQPLPHLPLLNPLDLGVATALLAAWLWLRSAAAAPLLARGAPQLPAVLMSGAGFVWLNAMLIRAFHHYGDVPFEWDAWMASLAVQTGLTLLWSGTALVLMWLSARHSRRAPWLVGACLLGAVMLKLLLIDLSGSGSVTRIVSFIGVGMLMLVIGYVAPMPDAESRHVETS